MTVLTTESSIAPLSTAVRRFESPATARKKYSRAARVLADQVVVPVADNTTPNVCISQKRMALSLKLEPLKAGLPEFETLLGKGMQQALTIGGDCQRVDLAVADEGVSKRHVILALAGVDGGLGLSVADASTEGTWVNGERLPATMKRFRVHDGDSLCIKGPCREENFGWKLVFQEAVCAQ
jgi:hypothetical protein